MGISQRLLITRLAALVALSTSVSLLVVHFFPNPRFCPFDSACEQVVSSRFGKILGIPLPFLGVLTFAAIFGLSLSSTLRGGQLLRVLALAAGAGGILLILLQVVVIRQRCPTCMVPDVILQLCPYCTVVDCSALVIGLAAFRWRLEGPLPALAGKARYVWLAGAIGTFGFGIAWGAAGSLVRVRDNPPPPQVTALWVPDKINVVEIADFECPHCRLMHRVLMRFLHEQGDRVHFVRITAPMPNHHQGRFATRAFLCASAQGKGDQISEELFAADDLAPEQCERIAESVGVSRAAFRACVADPATDRRIDADVAWVKTACPRGLPVVWVQDQMLFGIQSIQALEAALRNAEQRTNNRFHRAVRPKAASG